MLSSFSHTSTKGKEFALVVGGIFLMVLLSQISIPLKPVPVSLQTVGVLVIGLTYAPRAALLSQLGFLAMGAAGLPVFANFSGGAHLFVGPTAGYLFAFPLAAFVMASVRDHFHLQSKWAFLGLACVGQAIIYFFGVAWLANLMGFHQALMLGFLPFILPGIGKTVLTTSLVSYFRKK
ncbi:MAG: biotin transporter BioY [Alphaproteobacteria bacterium]|nr:biotin transporter BioY [Alphaproteobacteria bacterium]